MDSSQQQQQDAAKAPAPTVAEKKRRRPPLSCEQCRKRKIRCDRTQPCNNCVKSNIPSCTYAPYHIPAWRAKKLDSMMAGNRGDAAAAKPPLRNIKAAEPKRDAPPGPEAAEPNVRLGPPFTSDSTTPSSSKVHSSNAGSSSSSSSPNVDWLVARVHQLEEKLAKALRINDAPDGLKPRSASESAEPVEGFVAKSRYFPHSHWIYGMNVVSVSPSWILYSQQLDTN